MLTLNIDCEVQLDRVVTFKLPETVRPGQHELVVILEEDRPARSKAGSNAQALMQFAGSVAAFQPVDGVEYQRKMRADMLMNEQSSSVIEGLGCQTLNLK